MVLIDRITGSSLPRLDNVSLIDPQNDEESSALETETGNDGGFEAGGDVFTGAAGAGAGVGVR